MSQLHSVCIGDPDDEALHQLVFPDTELGQQEGCACQKKVQWRMDNLLLDSGPLWVTIWSRGRSIGELAHLDQPDGPVQVELMRGEESR